MVRAEAKEVLHDDCATRNHSVSLPPIDPLQALRQDLSLGGTLGFSS